MRIVYLLFFCGALWSAQAQQTVAVPCAYDHYVQQLEAAHPGFRQAMEAPFKRVADAIHQEKDLTVYTIPVVVHVVTQNEDQVITDETIASVIAVLNEDYRRLNVDASQVRDLYLDVVDDPFIEFELVGVERVSTTATFELNLLGGSLPDNVKSTAEGGSDAWDTEKHLNIWVCNIEGGSLLGYAYPPAGLEHWPEEVSAPSPAVDGVVIHYEVFRRTGTHTATGLFGLGETTIQVRGRTITHEVGHYLGLRHIWGDGLLSILGIPDCTADDGVADTPNQGLNSQFICDPTQNSCTDAEGEDRPDMFENFMDYAQDDCMNSFTAGQVAIMRSVLENERSGLIATTTRAPEPLAASSQFDIFPNPARDILQVQNRSNQGESFQLRLLNSQGQLILREGAQQRAQLNISDLPAGLYHLTIIRRGQTYVERIIVQ